MFQAIEQLLKFAPQADILQAPPRIVRNAARDLSVPKVLVAAASVNPVTLV
jgi:hypothetical protein